MSDAKDFIVLTWSGCDGVVKCDSPEWCDECREFQIGTPGALLWSDWNSQSENSPIKRCWSQIPDVVMEDSI